MTAISDKINNRVSSISEYMFNGFTGAVTGAISGGIDNAKKLGEGTKLLSEAVSGFIIGTGEDAARQALVEGKEEVDGTRSVIKGIINAGLAIAVPIILKEAKAGLNKIKTPGVNTVVGEVGEKAVKETSEEVTEEVAEKGAKSLANNADKFKIIKKTSAEETNNWWKHVMNYDNPPYKPGTIVNEIELTEKTTYARVYDGETSGMYGGWVMKAEDIEGLTPVQIQDKFALPSIPKYVTDVNLEAGTHLRTGVVNPLEGWGNGGGIQFDLMGQRTGEFVNERLLK